MRHETHVTGIAELAARRMTGSAVAAVGVGLMAALPVLALWLAVGTAERSNAAPPVVTNVTAVQRGVMEPVDIYYDLYDAAGDTCKVSIVVSTNSGGQYDIQSTNLAGDIGCPVPTGTQKHVTWDVAADLPMFTSSTVRVKVTADDSDCLVIDVSGGPAATNYPVTALSYPSVSNDEYKTTKILLRGIPAGSFVMGSPAAELGREFDEGPLHTVTVSSIFYIGVFEITQAQYSNVMGANPSFFPQGAHGPKRPVEQVSWNTIRGGTWPTGTLDTTTFMGKLQSKTGRAFDLPTEAQWEYACRAGTTNALNNDTNLQDTGQDPNVAILCRYWFNGGSSYSSDPVNGAHTTVGSYLANNWGLYDMHGNAWEWCLDWYAESYGGDETDPQGPGSGSYRVVRGACWNYGAGGCRSAFRRANCVPDCAVYTIGFRLSLPAGQ